MQLRSLSGTAIWVIFGQKVAKHYLYVTWPVWFDEKEEKNADIWYLKFIFYVKISLITSYYHLEQRASADKLRAAIDMGRKQYWPKQ